MQTCVCGDNVFFVQISMSIIFVVNQVIAFNYNVS